MILPIFVNISSILISFTLLFDCFIYPTSSFLELVSIKIIWYDIIKTFYSVNFFEFVRTTNETFKDKNISSDLFLFY